VGSRGRGGREREIVNEGGGVGEEGGERRAAWRGVKGGWEGGVTGTGGREWRKCTV